MALNTASVRTLFANLAGDEPEEFFRHVADDVSWTVLGTHPLAGHYTSKAAFQAATLDRLGKLFDGRLKLFTRLVHVDGEWAAVELYTTATARSGVLFNNAYCWVCRFHDERIVEVRAYLDSALVAKVIEAGEAAAHQSQTAPFIR